MTSENSRRCAHRDERGACQAYAQKENPFCFTHDPSQAEARMQARVRGGRRSHGSGRSIEIDPPRTAAQVRDLQAQLLAGLMNGSIREERARIASGICANQLKAIDMAYDEEQAIKKGAIHVVSEKTKSN